MAVDAGLLTNNLGEVKYNQIPDISAIANNYASMQGTQAQTNRTNILAQGDQLDYNNKVGAQDAYKNALIANPDMSPRDIIKTTAPFGQPGSDLAKSQIGVRSDNTKLTMDGLKTVSQFVQGVTKDPSTYTRARESIIQQLGPGAAEHLPTEFNPQAIQQIQVGVDKTIEEINRQKDLQIQQQTANQTGEHLIRSDENTARYHDAIAGNQIKRIDYSSPEAHAYGKDLTEESKDITDFAKTLPDRDAVKAGTARVRAALDKMPQDGGPITGAGADFLYDLSNLGAKVFGTSPDLNTTLKNTQDLKHVMGQMYSTAAATSPFKSSRGIPVADNQFIKEATVGEKTYTVPMLKQLVNVFDNVQQAKENDKIFKARFLVEKMGHRASYDALKIAKMQPKAILSIDGVTVATPDGQNIQFSDPQQAKAAYDKINQRLAEQGQ